jgi:hypothetical protein
VSKSNTQAAAGSSSSSGAVTADEPQQDEQQHQVQEEAVEEEPTIPEVDTSTMTAKEKRLHELRLKVSCTYFLKYTYVK